MTSFIDTNILVYAFADDPKADIASDLLSDAIISTQVLNEFANIQRNKLSWEWDDILDAAFQIEVLVTAIKPITIETHKSAIDIAKRLKIAWYDAFIVAAALNAGCATLYTEDMHHGLVIDGQLTISNPFLP
jgi:predicted nucleic acid-binding protein